MNSQNHDAARPNTVRALLIASLVAVAIFLVLGLIAFTRPLRHTATVKVPYTQQISLELQRPRADKSRVSGRRRQHRRSDLLAARQPGPGATRLPLDHQPSACGRWHRGGGPSSQWTGQLEPEHPSRRTPALRRRPHHHTRDARPHTAAIVARTGPDADGFFRRAAATPLPWCLKYRLVAPYPGEPFSTKFSPVLTFQLDPLELQPGGGSSGSSGAPGSSGSSGSSAPTGGLTPSAGGTIATASSVSNTVSIAGVSLAFTTLRWFALAGLLIAAACALLAVRLKRRLPSDPSALIDAEYGSLIVPVLSTGDDPARQPVDVSNIKALVQLAQCSERLILHHHGESADTYLVEDEGTLYRYRLGQNGQNGQNGLSAPLVPVAVPDAPDASEANGEQPSPVQPTSPDPPAPAQAAAPTETAATPDSVETHEPAAADETMQTAETAAGHRNSRAAHRNNRHRRNSRARGNSSARGATGPARAATTAGTTPAACKAHSAAAVTVAGRTSAGGPARATTAAGTTPAAGKTRPPGAMGSAGIVRITRDARHCRTAPDTGDARHG